MRATIALSALAVTLGADALARPPGADLLGGDEPARKAKPASRSLLRVEAWDAMRGVWRVTVGADGKAVWKTNHPAGLALHAHAVHRTYRNALDQATRAKLVAVLRRVCQMRHDAVASAKYRYKFTLERPGKKRCYVVFDGYDRNRRRQRRRSAVLATLRDLFANAKPKKMPAFPNFGGL